VVRVQYTIKRQIPTAAQWMALRKSVGWAVFEDKIAEKSLEATLFCVCAFDADELIGMGRVLGDGVISFYIGNVMVLPRWQGAGIGRVIIEEIMAYVREHAAPGAIARGMSIKGKEEFYTKLGFVARPDGEHGSGMSIYF
jgi:GNAT superfamily N-acetyltransferase